MDRLRLFLYKTAMISYGHTGKILHLDLTRRQFRTETPSPEIYQKFLGGKGLGGHYFFPFSHLDWDHPQMPLCIFTGPLTATIAPTSGRAHLVSRSPLTGLVGDASAGGRLGVQLKRAGWDGIVITGRSSDPVGIHIEDQAVRFEDATPLWGKDTLELHKRLKPGKASLAAIGPAGENGCKFASITVDRHHSAGRTGLGLTMGDKGIKYLMVGGTGKTRIHDPALLKSAREDILRLTAASPALMGQYGFTCLGTGAVFDLMDNRRMMPTDNFQTTWFAHAGQLNANAYAKAYSPRKHGCMGCHILCKKIGRHRGQDLALPEFETMSHFTALIGCRDMELVMAANGLCNALGMDTISAASTLACHREITKKDYTPDQVLDLLRDMAFNRGEGQSLNQGSVAHAKAMGQPETAMAVKGLELPAYDPRGAYGMSLGYAVSTRGGCHLRAYPISHEVFRKPVSTDRFSFSGKARIIKLAEDLNAAVDALIACKFTFFAAGLEEYAKALTAVTGRETSAHDLMVLGERIYFQERMINAANGFDVRHDDLPRRFFTQSGSSGNRIHIPPIDRDAFVEARKKYYTIRGLSPQGLPLEEKALELELPWKAL